jgi:hypothetical protein
LTLDASILSRRDRNTKPQTIAGGQPRRRIMRIRLAACAILIGIGSSPVLVGQLHANPVRSRLFGDIIVRPPRAIPGLRPALGHSAAMMPFPRVRPAAAPPPEPAAAKAAPGPSAAVAPAQATAPSSANDGDAPIALKTAPTFPPVVTFE